MQYQTAGVLGSQNIQVSLRYLQKLSQDFRGAKILAAILLAFWSYWYVRKQEFRGAKILAVRLGLRTWGISVKAYKYILKSRFLNTMKSLTAVSVDALFPVLYSYWVLVQVQVFLPFPKSMSNVVHGSFSFQVLTLSKESYTCKLLYLFHKFVCSVSKSCFAIFYIKENMRL